MKFLEKNMEIDYRKVVSVCIVLLLILVGYEAVQFKIQERFNKFEIKIDRNGTDRELLDKKGVMKIMRSFLGFDPAISNIKEIDFRGLEEKLEANPYVEEATIYLDARNKLHVLITQRKPIARVKTSTSDFYMTNDGIQIPLSNNATLRVPIVTGNIDRFLMPTNEGKALYSQLVKMLAFCDKDQFLSALIEQIDINNQGELVCIPKVGKERILFGDISDYEEKLEKLKKYYEWGKSDDGWNKYAYLNLAYKDQIALGK